MIATKTVSASHEHPIYSAGLPLPAWIRTAVVHEGSERMACGSDEFEVVVGRVGEFSLVSTRVENALSQDALSFQRLTALAYTAIARRLAQLKTFYPVRFWNFVPNILSPVDAKLDRYQVFNAGRFGAFLDWYSGQDSFDQSVATATGIGHQGKDLVIHTLASPRPAFHIANPRQCQPHRYSRRFGPMPPCFARATVSQSKLWDTPKMLIGGTASVRGEDSVHKKNIKEQVTETLENIEGIIQTVVGSSKDCAEGVNKQAKPGLARLDSLRVYYALDQDLTVIRKAVSGEVPHLKEIEFLKADICRSELRVEIEGTACVDADVCERLTQSNPLAVLPLDGNQ